MVKDKGGEENAGLPLFEYAKRFENFESYGDFDEYFIHCVSTCGIPSKTLAPMMDLSPSGISARMSIVPQLNSPRFSGKQIGLYILGTRDPRPHQYLAWLHEKSIKTDREKLEEDIEHLRPFFPALKEMIARLEK